MKVLTFIVLFRQINRFNIILSFRNVFKSVNQRPSPTSEDPTFWRGKRLAIKLRLCFVHRIVGSMLCWHGTTNRSRSGFISWLLVDSLSNVLRHPWMDNARYRIKYISQPIQISKSKTNLASSPCRNSMNFWHIRKKGRYVQFFLVMSSNNCEYFSQMG